MAARPSYSCLNEQKIDPVRRGPPLLRPPGCGPLKSVQKDAKKVALSKYEKMPSTRGSHAPLGPHGVFARRYRPYTAARTVVGPLGSVLTRHAPLFPPGAGELVPLRPSAAPAGAHHHES